ncbi:MAG: hypothetical protein HYW23_02890 [Candidatus Aenigmarchaeota archaeon]|nr:hypothetical protein [Candidatus Aenigmarchaeota archaeon]
MNRNLLIIGALSIMAIVFLAGCTSGSAPSAAPNVSSQNVENSSSTVESTASNFVNQSTPTADQVVPDLTS